MSKVVLATTQKGGRIKRVFNSLRKKYDVSILEPIVKEQVTRRLGRIPSAAIRWPLYYFQVSMLRSEILHFCASPNFVAIPALYKKCKFVFDYRSLFNEELEKEFPRSSLVNFAWDIETKLVERANVVLTVNNILAEKIRRRYGRKAYVIPNYPLKNFVPFRDKWEIRANTSKPIIFFFGVFNFTVDLENLLKCARTMPECEFWLAGDGPLKSWVQRQASPNVKLLGYIPYEEMPNYINACDVGIVPMKPFTKTPIFTDQDLLKVGELAALRKPIIASGVAPSSQYLSVKPDQMDNGIKEALSGNVPIPVPHYWEDHSEKILFELYDLLQ